MKKIISSFLCTVMLISLCACSTPKLEKKEFAKWIKQVPVKLLGNEDYSLYSVFDDPEKLGIKMDANSLTFTSKKDFKQGINESKDLLDELEEFDYKVLNEDQKITYDLLKNTLESAEATEDYYYLSNNHFDVNYGIQSNLPINLYFMEFTSKDALDSLLGVMKSTKTMFPKYVEFEKVRQDKGYGMSKIYMEEVIKQVNTFNKGDHSYLLEKMQEKIVNTIYLNESEKNEYKEKAKKIYEESFISAYKQLEDDLKEVEIKTKDEDAALVDYKNGKDYYASKIKENTGFESVSEYRKFINNEKNRIYERMMTLMYEYPTLQSEILVPSEEGPIFTNLDNVSDVLSFLENKINTNDNFPKMANVVYEMEVVPPALQEIFTAAAAYFVGPYDNPEAPEQMILNGSFKQSDYGTISHEGFPGHMYQFHYFRNTNHNIVRDILANSGYSEGWAVYASKEMSKYSVQPDLCSYQDLNEDMSYLYILELDAKIHYDNISRDEAYTILKETFGIESEEDLKAQYEQLLNGPAIFAPYYGYYLRLLNLKEEAKQKWKDEYSEYKFNKKVLDLGALPYNLLEKYMGLSD